MSRRRAVFFDRDGTLMEEVEYCSDPARVKVISGVPEALEELKNAGFLAIIVSNQSGIGRGLFTEAQYTAVQEELLRQIGAHRIDASYFCPDAPGVPSLRRKPAPGMVLEAAAEFEIDLAASFLVGDKASDIECGRRAGARTILVRTGYGAALERDPGFIAPDHVANDVPEAVHWVLRR
ncbi:MAG: HAD family hydrolase [Bryobacteraceae bacterium]|jgi:D-glycero-D-manno-heptose 1,7-bisphosphate phosphatase